MPTDQIPDIHSRVKEMLENSSLHPAFALLSSAISRQGNPELRDVLKRQEDTYKYMIHYFVEGYSDQGRENMLAEIISTLFFINDSLLRDFTVKDSPDTYSSTLRFERVRKTDIASHLAEFRKAYSMAALAHEAGGDVSIRKTADEALSALFGYVWTMYGAPSSSYKAILDAVKDSDLPFSFKAQMVSALLLGNLAYFDRKGLECLLDIYDADISPRLTARALTAIVFIVSAYPERVSIDPRLSVRLSLLNDSIIAYRQFREIIMNIIRARDTERISSKMRNEVLPELMKLRPEILKKLRNISEISDMEMLDVNPEWEDILSKNGLGDKLKELTEMQMEGGDVMMMAFSNLKSFPFFNNVSNWFLPFSSEHSDIAAQLADNHGFFNELLDMEGVMCDSDKFSFAFSLSHMPESQRKMLTDRMGEQIGQLKEAMAERKLKSSVPEFDEEVTRFIRDIYRFFKLFKKKNEFKDPFINPLDFKSLPFISDILSDPEIISLVGEFYFKHGYYAESLPLLLRLESDNKEDSLLWEKIGYCHNALGNLEEAMKWYCKAELVHPDSKWLMKKMALCSRLLNRFEDASRYYAKALESDPDNYHLLMSAGHSLLEAGDIVGALANYYHADYVKPGKASSWRAIAWAELMNHNFEKSIDYYDRIENQSDCNAGDFLNKGHACYLSGNTKKALECYKKCVSFKDYGIAGFEKVFNEDSAVLLQLGGRKDELSLILDKIRYDAGN